MPYRKSFHSENDKDCIIEREREREMSRMKEERRGKKRKEEERRRKEREREREGISSASRVHFCAKKNVRICYRQRERDLSITTLKTSHKKKSRPFVLLCSPLFSFASVLASA